MSTAQAVETRWRIELLGGLRAVRGAEVVTRYQTQQTGLLLAYLAYHRRRSYPREVLIDLLWPECEPEVGRHRLSVALSALRQRLEPEGVPAGAVIVADRASVRLNPDAVTTDVAEFEAALHAAVGARSRDERAQSLSRAVALYRGELLPGYYDDWVLQEREWLAERFFQALGQWIAHLEGAGELNRALEVAHHGVSADPLREEAHAELMRLYAAAGQPAAALRQYQELERLLQEQLETTPAPATRALAREIERQSLVRPQPVVAPPSRPSQASGSSHAPLPTSAEGENRLVTVLFADMSRSVETTRDLDPEDAAALVNRLLSVMVDAVLKYQGRVDRFLGDGMLAVFGTLQAHEEDPERAIRAAVEIREAARKLGLEVTAGINTGEVYVGAVGSARHQEQTAGTHEVGRGAVVNLAARLQEQAQPGEILVGQATYRQTCRAFASTSRSLAIKGLAQPVAAYVVERALPRPEKARGIEGLRGELIGREEELAKLQAALAELLQGHGQMVSLIGEAGIGKSRLVAELRLGLTSPPCPPPRSGEGGNARRPEESFSPPRVGSPLPVSGRGDRRAAAVGEVRPGERFTLLWLEGRCLELGMTASYSLFVDLFHDYLAWRPAEEDPGRVARLVAALQEFVGHSHLSAGRADEIGPLLGNLLSLRFGNDWDVRLKNTNPEHLKYQTLLAVRDFFVALAKQQPLVLVLEDLHWADSLSLDVISLLMEMLAQAPLLLLCAYRPEREQKCMRLGSLASRKCPERYTELVLRELTPSQSRRMLSSLLTVDPLPAALQEQILERAYGNPFFLEEMARSLIDAGMFDPEGRRVREGGAPVRVPARVQSVIRSRVDRLGPEGKQVLQTASVMGRLFRRRLLEQTLRAAGNGDVGGSAPEALERALWELEERGLIYQERVVPEEEYSFKHVLTQETIYQSLRRRHRAALHQRVGESIEALYPERLEEHAERLAYHYERSGAKEKAIEYLLKAGEKAQRAFLNEAAMSTFERALDRLERTGLGKTRPEWRLAGLKGLGQVHDRLAHSREVEQCFRQAIALGREMVLPAPELVRLYFPLGDSLFIQGRWDEVRSLALEGLALLGEESETVAAIQMNHLLGYLSYFPLDREKFREYMGRNARILSRLPESDEVRPGYWDVVDLYLNVERDVEEAWKWLQTWQQEAERHHSPDDLCAIHWWTGCLRRSSGDLRGAITEGEQALELSSRTGSVGGRWHALTLLSGTSLLLGELPAAEAYARRKLEVAEGMGPGMASQAYLVIGTTALCRGAWDEARDAFERTVQAPPETVAAACALGRLHLAQGEREKAIRCFQEVLQGALWPALSPHDLLLLVPEVVSGLDEALDDPDAFGAFCRRFREDHPEAAGPLIQ